jgi:hypothetical protein
MCIESFQSVITLSVLIIIFGIAKITSTAII